MRPMVMGSNGTPESITLTAEFTLDIEDVKLYFTPTAKHFPCEIRRIWQD